MMATGGWWSSPPLGPAQGDSDRVVSRGQIRRSFWTPAGRDGHITVQVRMWTLCSEIKNCQMATPERETKQGPFRVGGPRGPSRPRTQEVRPVGSQGLGRVGRAGARSERQPRGRTSPHLRQTRVPPPPFWPILGFSGMNISSGNHFPPLVLEAQSCCRWRGLGSQPGVRRDSRQGRLGHGDLGPRPQAPVAGGPFPAGRSLALGVWPGGALGVRSEGGRVSRWWLWSLQAAPPVPPTRPVTPPTSV